MLNDLGLDGIANAATLTSQRRQYLRYSTPYQSYSYRVIAPEAVVLKPPLFETLFTWLRPFSGALWACLFGSIFFSGLLHWALELDSSVEGGDFADYNDASHAHPRLAQLIHSLYLSAMSITTICDHAPTTIPAKWYCFVKTFTNWIVLAAYLANFAAGLATKPRPFQAVTGFDSFAPLGKPMCVRNQPIHRAFASANYPNTPTLVSGPLVTDVLDSIVAGTCIGGMGNDLELRYALGAADVQGKYCGLMYTESSFATFTFGIPFTANRTALPDAALNAINQAIDDFIFGGDYSNQCASVYFPVERPALQCSRYRKSIQEFAPDGTLPSLQVTDLAGVFLVQIFAAALALLYCAAKLANRRLGLDKFHTQVSQPIKRRASEAAALRRRISLDIDEDSRGKSLDEDSTSAAAAAAAREKHKGEELVGLPVR